MLSNHNFCCMITSAGAVWLAVIELCLSAGPQPVYLSTHRPDKCSYHEYSRGCEGFIADWHFCHVFAISNNAASGVWLWYCIRWRWLVQLPKNAARHQQFGFPGRIKNKYFGWRQIIPSSAHKGCRRPASQQQRAKHESRGINEHLWPEAIAAGVRDFRFVVWLALLMKSELTRKTTAKKPLCVA